MKYIFLCCLIFAVANADSIRPNGTRSANFLKDVAKRFDTLNERGQITVINEFVDMALLEARNLMIDLGYDPMELPDLYKKISYKLIIITYWGDLNLEKGWLQDTSTIYRQADVSLVYTNRVLKMTVPIAFKRFLFDYQYRVRIMGLGPSGGVEGAVEDIRVSFDLELDFNQLQLKLSDFEITKLNDVDIDFTGNILIDWLLELLTGTITTLFRGVIEWVCEIIVKNILNDIVDAVNEALAKIPAGDKLLISSAVPRVV